MRRAIAALSVVAGLAVLCWASAPKQPMSVSQKLAQRVQFRGTDDPKMTLQDILEDFTQRYGVRFEINEKAFRFENLMEPGKAEIASLKPLPEMKNVPLDRVLKAILARVPVPSGAALRVRGDRVEITTNAFLNEIKKLHEDRELPVPQAKVKTSLAAKLLRRIDYPGNDDPKATLDDVLADLTKTYGLPFLLNEKAFKFENIAEPGKAEVASPNPLPARKNTRLDTVLRDILGRIPAPSGAAFLVRREFVEITSGTFLQGEVWGDDPEGPRLPIVQVEVDKQPFDEVLSELAEQASFNILLDARAGDKAKTPVSADLYNVPLDTAVRLLASMLDLQPVRVDNVLYVTRAETAEAISKTRPKKPLNPNYSWTISGPSGTLIRVPND